jgi:RNA polymerase sigma-70 factor (ECF subfamily)
MLAQRPRTDRAFERLYRQHVHDVYRYALVVLSSPEDAEDVTQATFLNAYRSFGSGKRPRSAGTWLASIVHELCEQRARQDALRDEITLDDHAYEAVPDEESPTASDVRRAIQKLPSDQRAALIMREIEGHTYVEIAEILGVNVSRVEILIFRARRALREELEGALTCHDAERAISKDLDGLLSRVERRALRDHVRDCGDCVDAAKSQRAQRSALRDLANVPLPSSLLSFFMPEPHEGSLSSA